MDPQLSKLLDEHAAYFSVLPNGRIKCEINGHEYPPRLDAVAAFINGSKYPRLKAKFDVEKSLAKYEPFIVVSKNFPNMLYCALTGQLMAQSLEAVKKHMQGKKFVKAKGMFADDKLELKDEPNLTIKSRKKGAKTEDAMDEDGAEEEEDEEAQEEGAEEEEGAGGEGGAKQKGKKKKKKKQQQPEFWLEEIASGSAASAEAASDDDAMDKEGTSAADGMDMEMDVAGRRAGVVGTTAGDADGDSDFEFGSSGEGEEEEDEEAGPHPAGAAAAPATAGADKKKVATAGRGGAAGGRAAGRGSKAGGGAQDGRGASAAAAGGVVAKAAQGAAATGGGRGRGQGAKGGGGGGGGRGRHGKGGKDAAAPGKRTQQHQAKSERPRKQQAT